MQCLLEEKSTLQQVALTEEMEEKCEMARDYVLKSVVYSLNYVLKNVIAGYLREII